MQAILARGVAKILQADQSAQTAICKSMKNMDFLTGIKRASPCFAQMTSLTKFCALTNLDKADKSK